MPSRFDPAPVGDNQIWQTRLVSIGIGARVLDLEDAVGKVQSDVAQAVLARSLIETAALLFRLWELVRDQWGSPEFETTLESIGLGSRDNATDYKSINVLTCIDRCDRFLTARGYNSGGVREIYDGLSEAGHPNWVGAGLAYIDTANLAVRTQGEFEPRTVKVAVEISVAVAAYALDAIVAELDGFETKR